MSGGYHDAGRGRMSRANIALVGFLAIAFFFLVSEHRAHALSYLPLVVLLLCPLLHLFMHRGHRGHLEETDLGSGTAGRTNHSHPSREGERR